MRCSMIDAPAGTSAWRRLLSGIARPRDENSSRITSATAGWRTSSTPITAAIASRVMSSCVGPRPPHTITASARDSASSSASTMRPRLSPTFVWRRCSMPMIASCSPIHDEFVSTICPSSSSVPTATISQRMERQVLLEGAGGGGGAAPGDEVLHAADHREGDRERQDRVGDPRWSVAVSGSSAEPDRDLLHDRLQLRQCRWRARRGRACPSRSGSPGCRAPARR